MNRRIALERMTMLKAVETKAEAAVMRDFEENRKLGLGHFFTSADIDHLRPVQLAQLMDGTAGLKLVRPPGSTRAFAVTSRGARSLTDGCGNGRYADVYLDNLRIYSGRRDDPFDINSINPETIAGIEYYASPAQTPPRYANLNSVCGVLVIWTKR